MSMNLKLILLLCLSSIWENYIIAHFKKMDKELYPKLGTELYFSFLMSHILLIPIWSYSYQYKAVATCNFCRRWK